MRVRYALAAVEVSVDHGMEVQHLIVSPSVVQGKSETAKKLLAGREGLNCNATQYGSPILFVEHIFTRLGAIEGCMSCTRTDLDFPSRRACSTRTTQCFLL